MKAAAAEKEGVAARAAAAKDAAKAEFDKQAAAQAEAAAARGAAEKARRGTIEVGPGKCCPPRHVIQHNSNPGQVA